MDVQFPGTNVGGIYEFHSEFNGRYAYKNANRNYFLFFIEGNQETGKSRWVIENELGKFLGPDGARYHGYIRYEGDQFCPSEVGKQWHNVWNQGSIDQNIQVRCSTGILIKNLFCTLVNYLIDFTL